MRDRDSFNAALQEEFAKVIGQRIKAVRMLTPEEFSYIGWDEEFRRPYAIEMENGVTMLVSQDEEANGPGELLLTSPQEIAKALEEDEN